MASAINSPTSHAELVWYQSGIEAYYYMAALKPSLTTVAAVRCRVPSPGSAKIPHIIRRQVSVMLTTQLA